MSYNGTIEARFQVLCTEQDGSVACGLVEHFHARRFALEMAVQHKRDHPGMRVIVFDLMAHEGQPEEWSPSGEIIARRGSRSGRIDGQDPIICPGCETAGVMPHNGMVGVCVKEREVTATD